MKRQSVRGAEPRDIAGIGVDLGFVQSHMDHFDASFHQSSCKAGECRRDGGAHFKKCRQGRRYPRAHGKSDIDTRVLAL